MPKCRFTMNAPDGSVSVLQEELEALYGERAAIDVMFQVEEALKQQRFGSRKMRANGEPTVAQVQELLKSRTLDPPTSAMVNLDKLDRIKDVVAKSLAVVNKRLERYNDPKSGGSALRFSAEAKRELRALKERLESLDQLDAYVALVEFADRQLREYKEFVTSKFNAEAAAESDGANLHPAALDEIMVQLRSYEDVFQPELAKDHSALKEILVGHGDTLGLQRQKEELDALVTKAQADYLTALNQRLNNRQGLSEEKVRETFKGGVDVTAITKALGGATQSSAKQLSLVATVVDMAKLRGRDLGMKLGERIAAADAALKAAGVKDFGFLLGLDKNGKADGTFVQKIGRSYWDERKALKDAAKEAGEYIPGSGLSQAQREHNVKVWEAKTALREFNQAEFIDENGVVSDGENHRYTEAFKAARAANEELRQDGTFWYWAQKDGVSDDAYAAYKAKYYGEKREVMTMVRVKDASGNKVPTGEMRVRVMQFTNEKATTEIVEENHRSARYQAILDDTSTAGKAKRAYYDFFTSNLNDFVRVLPKEDGQHLLRGELPAVLARVMTRYNSKMPGWTDYMGKVVTNPVGLIKDMLPAAIAGRESIRTPKTREDGTLAQEAPRKYTGRFRSEEAIASFQQKLAELDPKSKTFAADKTRLQELLTVEQNRPVAAQVETDLSKLLHTFGAMALNYEQLKEQEGTINLLRDSIRNRTFYEEDGKGNYKIGEDGRPIQKPGTYSSQLQRQTEDWLSQNYFQETGLGKGPSEKWGRAFKQYVSITFQGLNYAAALKNISAGNLANRIYAVGGQFGWDKKIANRALAEVTKESAKVVADNLAEHWEGGGLVLHPKRSKVDAIMATYGFLEHESKLTGNGLLSQLAFLGVTVGEYHIQSQIALAKLMSTSLVGKDGNTKLAYDIMSLVNGKLEIDPNYAEAWDKIRHRVVLDVRNIVKHTQGNHSDQDKVALEKEWMGASILQFHRWVYNGFKNRWGREQFDEGIGITTEGYYRGLLRLGQAFAAFGVKMSTYHNLPEHDKALVRMALQEMKYAASLFCLVLLAGYLKPEPDDDEKHLWYLAANLAERVLSGTQGEMTVFANPLEVYNLAKNPVAGIGMVRDMGVFVKNIAEVPFYGLSGNEDKLYYQTGSRKGQSKLWKSTKDLIPILRMDRIFEQLQTTGQPWIR